MIGIKELVFKMSIQYTSIKDNACCGGPSVEYQIPIGATPHEISLLIPGISIEKAIELSKRSIEESTNCPELFENEAITETVTKYCLYPGIGESQTITVPEGLFTSQLSQLDANEKAQAYFEDIKQDVLETLNCIYADCTSCTYRVIESKPCGEIRVNQVCLKGQCVDSGENYLVQFANSDANGNCKSTCTTCSALCPTGSCPPQHICQNGVCVPQCLECSNACPTSPCANPCQKCIKGKCVDIICPSGMSCVNGVCVEQECNPLCDRRIISETNCKRISIKQECKKGSCVDIPNTELTEFINQGLPCGNNSLCDDKGNCLSQGCVPACDEGTWQQFECFEQRRYKDCLGSTCSEYKEEKRNKPDGTNCNNGSCIAGVCVPTCTDQSGSCVNNTTCCNGLECRNGTCQPILNCLTPCDKKNYDGTRCYRVDINLNYETIFGVKVPLFSSTCPLVDSQDHINMGGTCAKINVLVYNYGLAALDVNNYATGKLQNPVGCHEYIIRWNSRLNGTYKLSVGAHQDIAMFIDNKLIKYSVGNVGKENASTISNIVTFTGNNVVTFHLKACDRVPALGFIVERLSGSTTNLMVTNSRLEKDNINNWNKVQFSNNSLGISFC